MHPSVIGDMKLQGFNEREDLAKKRVMSFT
jgi:hypothetical protein